MFFFFFFNFFFIFFYSPKFFFHFFFFFFCTNVSNEKFSKLFVRAAHMIRVKGFPSLVLRLGTGLIRTFLLYPNMERGILRDCLNAIIYCVMFGSRPFYKPLAVEAFESALKLEFAFRSRRCFNLFTAIAKCNSLERTKKESVRLFLKNELIPILVKNVEQAEQRRGIGYDGSLRTALQSLQADCEPNTLT